MSKILKPEHTSARKPFREHLVYPLVFQMRKISPLEVNFYIYYNYIKSNMAWIYTVKNASPLYFPNFTSGKIMSY